MQYRSFLLDFLLFLFFSFNREYTKKVNKAVYSIQRPLILPLICFLLHISSRPSKCWNPLYNAYIDSRKFTKPVVATQLDELSHLPVVAPSPTDGLRRSFGAFEYAHIPDPAFLRAILESQSTWIRKKKETDRQSKCRCDRRDSRWCSKRSDGQRWGL